jgi:hypothetical protein
MENKEPLFPYWWDTEAYNLSELSKRNDDGEMHLSYPSNKVRQSIVRIREDLILLLSQLSSANKQLRTISRICFCILLILIFILLNLISGSV